MNWEQFEGAETFKNEHRRELAAVLKTECLAAALKLIIFEEYESTPEKFNNYNFSDPTDVSRAIRHQGRIEGILHVVERLHELGEEDG